MQFDAAVDSLTLSLEAVDKRLPSANPHLAQINDQVMIKYLAQLNRDDIIQRTKAAIIEQLPSGGVTIDEIAKELYMSTRNLQRQLQERGTTFTAQMDEIRRKLAETYIQDRRLGLSEISFLLGFSEHSSFSRAFKRWTGESPTESRAVS